MKSQKQTCLIKIVLAAHCSSLRYIHRAVILLPPIEVFASSHISSGCPLWRLAGASSLLHALIHLSLKISHTTSLGLPCLGVSNQWENATAISFLTKRMMRVFKLTKSRLEVGENSFIPDFIFIEHSLGLQAVSNASVLFTASRERFQRAKVAKRFSIPCTFAQDSQPSWIGALGV